MRKLSFSSGREGNVFMGEDIEKSLCRDQVLIVLQRQTLERRGRPTPIAMEHRAALSQYSFTEYFVSAEVSDQSATV